MVSSMPVLGVFCFALVLIWNVLKSLVLSLKPSCLDTRKSIDGHVALVTGGGNGLGRELSLRMAELGATIVIWDVDAAAAEATKKMIQDNGQEAHVYICDVSDRKEVYRMAELVKEQVGKVDILVNNAGVALAKTFDKMKDEEIEKVYGINILSQYWTCRAFLPDMMKENSGHILAIASVAGFACGPSMCDYSATKHAVMAFMECLRMEVILQGAPGVGMTTACPFFMRTELFATNDWIPYIGTRESAHTIVDGMLRNKDVVVLPSVLALCRGAFKNLMPPSAMVDAVRWSGRDRVLNNFFTKGVSHVLAYKTQSKIVN